MPGCKGSSPCAGMALGAGDMECALVYRYADDMAVRWRSRRSRHSLEFLREVDPTASAIAVAAGLALMAAIYFGSRELQNFDAALIGYVTATMFLFFGVTYRYVVWVQSPPAAT